MKTRRYASPPDRPTADRARQAEPECVESFNGRLRDECLNEHRFNSLDHARALIEAWRCEYNEELPKKSLGGLTPAQYEKQLAIKAVMMPADSEAIRY